MKNFFQNNKATEVLTQKGEIFVFGDALKNITTNTPVMYINNDSNQWGDGSEKIKTLPIPDDCGGVEWQECRVYEAKKWEFSGTAAESAISAHWKFNA